MRWNHSYHKNGEERTRKVFLWLPRCACLSKEMKLPQQWRWLETATVTERFIAGYDGWVFLFWVD